MIQKIGYQKNYDASIKEIIRKREFLDEKIKPLIEKGEALVEIDKYTNNIKQKLNDSDDLGMLGDRDKKKN